VVINHKAAINDVIPNTSAPEATQDADKNTSQSVETSEAAPCEPRATFAKARTLYPSLNGLTDEEAVGAMHQAFYRDLTIEQVAEAFCFTLTPLKKGVELSSGELSRYENCQKEAAMAPTERGVNQLTRLCKEKFGQ